MMTVKRIIIHVAVVQFVIKLQVMHARILRRAYYMRCCFTMCLKMRLLTRRKARHRGATVEVRMFRG